MRYAEVCCNPYSVKLFMAKLVPHLLEKGYSADVVGGWIKGGGGVGAMMLSFNLALSR